MSHPTPRPTRRAVARGAVWTVPVIAVASAAPSFAGTGVDPLFACLTQFNPTYNKAYGGLMGYRAWYSTTWSIAGSGGCAPAGQLGFTVTYASTATVTLTNGQTYTGNLVSGGSTSGFTGNVTVAPIYELPGTAGVGSATNWTKIVSTMTISYGGKTQTYVVTAVSNGSGGIPTITWVPA